MEWKVRSRRSCEGEEERKPPPLFLKVKMADAKEMTLSRYQELSRRTAVYPGVGKGSLVYPTLGLVGEAGEIAEKVKKILRDQKGAVNDQNREDLLKEIGDVLWYVAALASELQVDLQVIALLNLSKLDGRKNRGVLGGSGDDR